MKTGFGPFFLFSPFPAGCFIPFYDCFIFYRSLIRQIEQIFLIDVFLAGVCAKTQFIFLYRINQALGFYLR